MTINDIIKPVSIEFSIWERKLLLALVDFSIVTLGLLLYYKIDSPDLQYVEILKENIIGFSYGLVLFWILSSIFNLYNLNFANTTRKILPLVVFIGLLYSITFVFTPRITPFLPTQRIIVLGFVGGVTFSLSLWRVFYAHYIHAPAFFKKVMVLISCDLHSEYKNEVINVIQGDNIRSGYKVLKVLEVPKEPNKKLALVKLLNKTIEKGYVDNIVLLNSDHSELSKGYNKVFTHAIQRGIEVKTYHKIYEELKEAIPLNLAGKQFYSLFPISRHNSNYFYQLWNRIVDISSAIFGLLIMFSITPIILIVNLFINRGPLFYSQLRVGKGGNEYKITKFRSMVTDAEKYGAKMSTKGDARITKFGKFMRKTRIDELPQFWAVLIGDMSLIGPRPERKVFVDQLAKSIPFYNARHLIRPGITGWAQVKYPYGENLEDSYHKLEYDLYYIKNRSITLDIRIIIKTINTVIFSKGQ